MTSNEHCPLTRLTSDLQVGDVVFIRVLPRAFREVASSTGTWTNHVGVVVDLGAGQPWVAESKFPFAKVTPLAAFIRRSEQGRVAVRRLSRPLSDRQRDAVREAAERRLGTLYDTGFNVHSGRQFCSRYVREVLREATGISIGEVQSFEALLRQHPQANLRFWKCWFFGRIPWARETVSPASLLHSPELRPVFEGHVTAR